MKHRRSIPRTQRGFTLVEILVTTAIFAIIMIAALTVYDQSNKVFKTSTEQADMQQSTRIGFDKLVSDLRMAGFDYSRGGTPIGAGQFAQPDEQIEYAGPTAVAFRANFNYTSAAAQGNGLEPTYTPKADANGMVPFPYVTTSNNEIVIYALKSADTTKNTNSIKFYADVAIPRAGYPGGANGGRESEVDVNGIDTTNANPPYTLYRMTVSDVLSGSAGTPVAENIRALHFFYYTDAKGTTLLGDPASANTPPDPITTGHDAGGTTFSTTYTLPNGTLVNTGAIGGDGQADPGNPSTANVIDRTMRATIQSIKVDLTGMNANPDKNYTNPTETVAAIKSYRQYQLSALIVPRNLGLTGFPEPSYTPPGPPTITGMCVSACAVPVICWAPPTTAGQVLSYRIEWDSSQGGAFSHYLVINDPTVTSAVIPDDGVMDPSLTWYYQMWASNDNGQSTFHSNVVSVSPKNMTRPMPPSGVTATIATAPAALTPANVDYTIGLNWTAPSQNDPAVSGATCTGGGCTADGTKIPTLETIRYKVARGLTSNFDPEQASQRVIILDIPTKSQPQPPPAAGSPVSWSDSPTNSIFAPGTCVQYYYRVQAQDRCAANSNYNASKKTTDSVSDWSPAIGTSPQAIGKAYDAGAGVQASAPPTILVDSTKSLCPAIGTCTIYLNWAQTTTDNAGHAIGVDKYRISRFKKIITDTDYVLDTMFGTNGYLNQSGASQTNSGTVSLTDSAPAADINGQPLYYKYVVAANDCRLGLDSAPAYYPALCTVNPVIVEAGANNASATGDSPSQAWVFNAGDTITVTPPVSGGITISKVEFTLYAYPSLTQVDYSPVNAAPFKYTYGDRTDNQIYYMRILVTSSAGCTETHVKYIQDQQAASCSIVNQTAPVPSEATSGSTVTASAILTIQNKGSETITLNNQSYSLTFIDPDGNHSDIALTSVVFASTNTWTDTLTTPATPSTVTRFFPIASPVLTVAAGANLTATIRWQYSKQDAGHKDRVPIAVSPLTKLCIGYTIASEPGVVKKCNVVGQAASSVNPTSCD